MAFLEINPRYQQLLEPLGLAAAEHFLEMPSVIICGHPDRNVARVTLQIGPGAIPAFLKREHRIPWKERLLNALAQFGLVSKSRREAMILRSLQQAGIPCPDWIAVGEDDQGRAFLLLRELTGTQDLRCFLQEYRHASSDQRRRFARRLGEALAGFHNAGFNHPDLFSKHVLVHVQDQTVSFLDWQRSRQRFSVAWRRRYRDLAALEATLADQLATVRERLECLRAYLRTSRMRSGQGRTSLRSSARQIRRLANRLLCQRRFRELRQVPVASAAPALIWQDGEAFCLTPQFQSDLEGCIPDWLVRASFSCQPKGLETRSWMEIPKGRRALLIRRRGRLPSGLWAFLRRRSPVSPELRRAGLLFRLERYGIRVPRLLAFGQRAVKPWRMDSFLLTEPIAGAVPLSEWLAAHPTELGQRRHVIREAANLLRRLHSLHCYLGGQRCLAVVQPDPQAAASVVLAKIDGLSNPRRPSNRDVLRDVATFYRELSTRATSRTDALRFLLSYLGPQRPRTVVKQWARALGDVPICNLQFAICNLQFLLLQPQISPEAKPRTQGALP
jgi:tRNA A-37 threonylcarbamoyl transferase component Bud32